MKKFIFFSFCFIALSTFAQKEKIKVTDLLNVKTVSSVTLSNDASKVAFSVLSIEPDAENKGEYKYVNQIWITAADGSTSPKQLTTSKEGSAQPAFSPDGKQIAFVRLADGKPQIFLLSLDGGEAIQLTKYKYGAGAPKWTADGKRIIFSTNISLKDLLRDSVLNPKKEIPKWPYEKTGFDKNENLKFNTAKPDADGNIDEIRAYLDNNEKDKKAKVFTKLQFQEESTTSNEISFSHFFIVDAKQNATPVELTHGFYRYNSVEFTPDGKNLIISGNIDSTQHPDRSLENQIFITDTDGSNLKLLLGEKNKNYNSPKLSPSGKWLAYQFGNTGFVDVPQLAIMPLNGNTKDIVTINLDRAKGNLIWSADEKYLYLSAQSNGGIPVYRVDIKTKQVERLSEYDNGINGFDLKENKIAFSKTEVASPFELYVADANMKNAKRLSSFNIDWLQNKQLSFPEKHSFINNKNETIEYWVMKPINYEAGKKYPLLLNIHGGPTAMWGPGENSMWHEFQYFCAKGYGVVYCNPRGSGGYGAEFLKANVNDWGDGPTSDVLTALDKAVAEGWADTSKLLITGGSYAGYLVSWIIAHDHRFKAACSQRGVYDLSTFFGEGNAWRLVPNYFGGYPWQHEIKKLLDYESPITYVQNITTPYIIFHGENDLRTGTIQGEMLYKSLKVLGRPVEYVKHPGATHEITRSGNNLQRIDQMLRTYEFFERWLNK
jgi:dipeptidyl aminopeptidase/acylaminoacyl peptidase